MNPFDNYSWFILKRQEELMKRADEIHLVNVAYQSDTHRQGGFSKLLANLVSELGGLGFSLELGYGGQPEPSSTLRQEGTTGGCA